MGNVPKFSLHGETVYRVTEEERILRARSITNGKQTTNKTVSSYNKTQYYGEYNKMYYTNRV